MTKTGSSMRPTLLLVEDDPRLGPLTRDVLEKEYAVTLVDDGDAGLRAARAQDFDVIVLDRRLPGIDGLEILTRLRLAGSPVPVLMLTALGEIDDRVAGLDSGADDYLVKPFDFKELFARLRAVRRVFPPAGPVIALGEWEFYPHAHMISSPYEGQIGLTGTESELLLLFASNPGRVISRARIKREVFPGTDSDTVVDTYVHYLRKKTDRDVIVTVRGAGYRLGEL